MRPPVLLFLVAAGCGEEGEQAPPWERDTPARDAGIVRDAGDGFRPTVGRPLEPGTRSIRSGGFSADVGGEALAMLETDLDGDGRADVVVATRPVATPSDAGPTSVVLARMSAWRAAPEGLVVAEADMDPIEVNRLCDPAVKIRRPSRRAIVVDASNDCPEERLRTSGLSPIASGARARFRVTLTGRARDPER